MGVDIEIPQKRTSDMHKKWKKTDKREKEEKNGGEWGGGTIGALIRG